MLQVRALTRQEEILEELDRLEAPDAAYMVAFSTATKVRLKRGETWRQRLVAWIAKDLSIGMKE